VSEGLFFTAASAGILQQDQQVGAYHYSDRSVPGKETSRN
jgi:hypothetical protein